MNPNDPDDNPNVVPASVTQSEPQTTSRTEALDESRGESEWNKRRQNNAAKDKKKLEAYANAKAYLERCARGEEVPARQLVNKAYRFDAYADALLTALSFETQLSKQNALAMAVVFCIQNLPRRSITSTNELALLTHGLQFCVHDFAVEVRELRALAVSIANQESFTVDPGRS